MFWLNNIFRGLKNKSIFEMLLSVMLNFKVLEVQ